MQDDLEESAERKACQFKRSWLGDCSGLQDPHYGYSQGRPCVLLRMNRVRRVPALSRKAAQRCVSGQEATLWETGWLERTGFSDSDILWPFQGDLHSQMQKRESLGLAGYKL